jgi:hypothetical protein
LIATGIADAAIELGANEVLELVEDVGFAEEAGCLEELGSEAVDFEVAGLEVIFNDVAANPNVLKMLVLKTRMRTERPNTIFLKYLILKCFVYSIELLNVDAMARLV